MPYIAFCNRYLWKTGAYSVFCFFEYVGLLEAIIGTCSHSSAHNYFNASILNDCFWTNEECTDYTNIGPVRVFMVKKEISSFFIIVRLIA